MEKVFTLLSRLIIINSAIVLRCLLVLFLVLSVIVGSGFGTLSMIIPGIWEQKRQDLDISEIQSTIPPFGD